MPTRKEKLQLIRQFPNVYRGVAKSAANQIPEWALRIATVNFSSYWTITIVQYLWVVVMYGNAMIHHFSPGFMSSFQSVGSFVFNYLVFIPSAIVFIFSRYYATVLGDIEDQAYEAALVEQSERGSLLKTEGSQMN